MSRSGYDDGDDGEYSVWLWRQAVSRAIKGKRGQAFLREMIEALDAMPEKRLFNGALESEEDGSVCALGAVVRKRGLDLPKLNYASNEYLADSLHISRALVCEIEYLNDEQLRRVTPEDRWVKMRAWAVENLVQDGAGGNDAR